MIELLSCIAFTCAGAALGQWVCRRVRKLVNAFRRELDVTRREMAGEK